MKNFHNNIETVNYFLSWGNRINRNKTLEKNNNKNNDISKK